MNFDSNYKQQKNYLCTTPTLSLSELFFSLLFYITFLFFARFFCVNFRALLFVVFALDFRILFHQTSLHTCDVERRLTTTTTAT